LAIADYTRIGKIKSSPWSGTNYIALQGYTRLRLHLAKSVNRKKSFNPSIVPSFKCIKLFDMEIKTIDKAILQAAKALDNH